MTAVIPRHKLVEVLEEKMPAWGKEMLYIEDQVMDVELTLISKQSMTFVAKDLYGVEQAAACVALHLIENLSNLAELYDFVMDGVFSTLACSYLRGGRAVHLA